MRPDIVKTFPFIDQWRGKGFQYLILPKTMLTEGRSLGIGCDEALLYAILKDRAKSSFRNEWIDKDGHVYIIYTRDEAARYLGWSKRKAVTVFSNLVAGGLLTEQAQSNAHKFNQPKRLYVRLWCEPSLRLSLAQIKSGELPFLSARNVFADTGAYYIIPTVLFEHEIYKGLSNRAILLYVMALDQMHLSIAYGKVDKNNLVWCQLDAEATMNELDCGASSLTSAYQELEDIGLMVRTRDSFAGKFRIYIRDYLPPPADSDAIPMPTGGSVPTYPPKFAPLSPDICTTIPQDLHNTSPSFAPSHPQDLHPNQTVLNQPPNQPSLISIATSVADAPMREDMCRGEIKALVDYDKLIRDIDVCFPVPSESLIRHSLVESCLNIMVQDMLSPADKIRIADDLYPKAQVLAAYSQITEAILYTLVDKIAPRLDTIRQLTVYLHRGLLTAYIDHGGAAYFTQQAINQQYDARQQEQDIENLF